MFLVCDSDPIALLHGFTRKCMSAAFLHVVLEMAGVSLFHRPSHV